MRDPQLTDLSDSTDIAIVGMAGRFPGARSVDEFWHNLKHGVESITRFSDDELIAAGVDPALLSDPSYVKAGAVLADADTFDAEFFGLTPLEARIMDPQQRLFVETVWSAIENAGHNVDTFNGTIGLFAGAGISTYLLNNLLPNAGLIESAGSLQVGLGNDKDSLATRAAYLLNLTGPCYTVQTYCSTSLVAVSIASSSLLNGECDMALAGGVLVQVPQATGYLYQEGGIASPDGRCRAFDAEAKGAPLGNGVAVVALRRLADAIADGNEIYAVIKGSAVNNDGSLKVGYTAPGVRGQTNVIIEALANADVDPATVSYIETHGTGTALGDAAEFAALVRAFRSSSTANGFCAIGSVKTNVGHLDRAAGVTGLIKTALALKNELIPPSLNFETPNPQLNIADSPFVVNTALSPWLRNGHPRRAGVSAFGIGGTNAHVVLEEAPDRPIEPALEDDQLLIVSARSEAALETATENLATYLAAHPDAALADVAFTLQLGRRPFAHRRALVARDATDAAAALAARDPARLFSAHAPAAEREAVLLFPGVGDHYAGMARALYQRQPVFRTHLDRCCALLAPYLDADVRALLLAEPAPAADAFATLLGRGAGAAPDPLTPTRLAQPAVFAVEYALARLLLSWGLRPRALIGYSLGEYTAATIAGVLTLEDAARLVATRAVLIDGLPGGSMLALACDEATARGLVAGTELDIAATTGPLLTVVAGTTGAVAALEARLTGEGMACKRVATTHAFHSRMLAPIAEQLRAVVAGLRLEAPKIPYVSNVTGTWITAEEAQDGGYWVEHLLAPVRLEAGLGTLLGETGDAVLVEVGPGQALSALVKQQGGIGREQAGRVVALQGGPQERGQEWPALARGLGRLWLAGAALEWAAVWGTERRRRVALPTYPFERQRFWIDAATTPVHATTQPASAKRADVADWFYLPVWEPEPLDDAESDEQARTWLIFEDEHGVGDRVAQRLRERGHTCVGVRRGERFARTGELSFELRPNERTDYVALLGALREQALLPRAIAHLWSVARPDGAGVGRFAEAQERGFYSLLWLAQALEEHAASETISIAVLSEQAQAVGAGDTIAPERAPAVALCRVLAQEYPGLRCSSIDIARGGDDEALTALLVGELAASPRVAAVAYRDATRYVQSYRQTRLEAATGDTPPLRRQGVYLITGGLGGVGLMLAEHLARTVQARLVLVGRGGLPPRSEWESRLAGDDSGDLARRIGRVQQLEALGAEVLVLAADVAAEAQMRAVVAHTLDRFGALHGVIHAAGLTDERSFQVVSMSDRDGSEAHFNAKAYGVYVLEQVLEGVEADFCLLMSSLSTVLGGLGFAAYSAANSFMDAFAQHKRAAGDPRWISVDWDTWQGSSGTATTLPIGDALAAYAMSEAEGIDAFTRVLAAGAAHIVTSTGDLDARLQQWVALDNSACAARATATSTRPELATTFVAAGSDFEQRIASIWQAALGIEQVGVNDNFFDLGGNSLIGLQLITRLKREFNIQIPAVALFEAPTISALARYLRPEAPRITDAQVATLGERRKQARRSVDHGGVALIAMNGRFPGARNIEQFWSNLRDGVESISVFDDDELLAAGVDPEALGAPNYVKARPIIEDIDLFDAGFFGYSPREAEAMDPQQRLFLEVSWEALEQAGYIGEAYKGLVGVFAGTNISTYLLSLVGDPEVAASVNHYQAVIGNDKDALTTTVSYKLNLKGPSFAVQTFCSTSLVATHLACQSLLNGECDIALAGGVSIRVPNKTGYLYEQGGQESPDGHCRTFDADAHGSLFGDGVGVVVLKRLADALADGDTIHAVIKGSAVNNDGSLKVGYTAPSVTGQADVVVAAMEAAGVTADSIDYIEAHGTATELGDPIEVASLTRAFRTTTEARGFCRIGSVKTNVGHLDRAAGVSGLIKTALALKNELIPPTLHYQTPNPEIDFETSPFVVNTALSPWLRNGHPRRAGINSLGMGGTNAHVVLEEAPEPEPVEPSQPWQLLIVSARSEAALETATENLATYLAAHPDAALADVAFTLQLGRRPFAHRRALVARDATDAAAALAARDPARLFSAHAPAAEREAVLLFPGVGDHYAGMARALYQRQPVFRTHLDRCCALLAPYLDADVRALLLAEPAPAADAFAALLGRGAGAAPDPLTPTRLAQPAVFAVEYALARLLLSWGLRPRALIGYSLGEYTAATIAGVLTLEDAARLVATRAQLIDALPGGSMLALACDEATARGLVAGTELDIAATTGPLLTVVAGTTGAVAALEARLTGEGIACKRVATTHAFHSRMLAPIAEQLRAVVAGLRLEAPKIPYVSNVTGTWITAEEAQDGGYWVEHLLAPVRLEAGLGTLLGETGDAVLVEVGPGQALSALVKQQGGIGREQAGRVVALQGGPQERGQEWPALARGLGRLWLAGAALEWAAVWGTERRRRVALPTYPFERQRFWIEPRKRAPQIAQSCRAELSLEQTLENIKREEPANWFYVPGWKQTAPRTPQLPAERRTWLVFDDESGVGARLCAWLRDHEQTVVTVRPGAGYFAAQDGSYTVAPAGRADYGALLAALREQEITPAEVLHLWNVTPDDAEPVALAQAIERSFHSLLALAQALVEAGVESCRVSVVSNEVHNISGGEALRPEKATLVGPCKVIPLEHPSLACRNIDITLPSRNSWQADALFEQLLGEISGTGSEPIVALRGHQRWVQTWEPMALPEPAAGAGRLRRQGVYLITGGLGGIGLGIAEHLARTLQARLVLVGRSGLPARERWPELLAGDDSGDLARRIGQVQQLEALGAEVLVLAADVAAEAQMRAVVAHTLDRFGALHGVIHAAGVPGIGLIPLKTAAMAEDVMAPKLHGTLALERALEHVELDFLALFSSITSATGGGPGQIDYCAANAFLDAYAQHNAGRHGRTVAINWGEWQWNAWEKGLAGYSPEVQEFFRANRQRFGISFAEGAAALERVLASGQPQLVVSTQDFRKIVELSTSFTVAHVLQQVQQDRQARSLHARPTLGTSFVAPRSDLERRISAVWCELLGLESIGIDDNFFELGGNSLIGIDLIARLRKVLGVPTMPAHVLYEAPTINAMAALFDQNMPRAARVEERLDRGARRRERQAQRRSTA